MSKINLKGLDLAELEDYVESIGEKRFRARQLFGWMYGKGVRSFDDMTNLGAALRAKLAQQATVSLLELRTALESRKDESIKYVFHLEDRMSIESVLMVEEHRTTLCISTQVGCAIDCKFCATGMMGLKRNLSSGEIVDQLLAVQFLSGHKVTNVVCMGMGEPFHNYDNLMTACALMSAAGGPGVARRHIVVSTSGLIPRIYQFADERQKYRLAISLNATRDDVRTRIMPLNKKWPIRALLDAARYYSEKMHHPVTFEYVLLNGINDSLDDADRLKELMRGLLCKVNLIPYNATSGAYQRPPEHRILQFYSRLAGMRAPVTIRWSKGDDIDAGCGQLAARS
ncbi:MAG: 23S rRNA (adenine(2503)-C(2))-methyltransferase RlmN [bacterium]